MKLKEAQQFVADFAKGNYSPAEHAIFLQWVKGASANELDVIADEHEAMHEQWVVSATGPSPEWVVAIENRLDRLPLKTKNALVVAMHFGIGAWIAVASVIALVVGGTVWYNQSEQSAKTQERQQMLATLTQVTAVARGGEQQAIILPDGSKVVLNVASTLKYPAGFTGTERVVQLSGEAYFEVTQRPNMPFRVLFRDADVQVLGTHFNIMAYDNEPVSKATLIDGSVRVECGSQGITLYPGEQGEIPYPSPGATGPIRVIPGIDPAAVLAWKNGDLKFDNIGLYEVLRILERVYNVDIQIGQNVPDIPVTANFTRSNGLDYILNHFEQSEHLHIVTNGKKVTVTFAT